MQLFEFEAKKILKDYHISIPDGDIASNPDEAEAIAHKIGKPVAVKSQILISGRGKTGGIIFASQAAEAKQVATRLLGSSIQGKVVSRLLIEEKLDIAAQFYASVAIDRQARTYIVLASTEGGIDIEETALASPDRISRHWVDPEAGFHLAEALEMLSKFHINKKDTARFADILNTLYTVSTEKDAELVEVNPLVKTTSGEFVAADARIIVDDNALFRHPEFDEKNAVRADDTPLEAEARKLRLAYVDLSGDIGIASNGAGLAMATLDLVHHYGGSPANFLDIGGGGNVESTKKGLLLVMSKPEVKAVLVNILGGITRCDVVAQAILEALRESSIKKPVVARIMGRNEAEGREMLRLAGISTHTSIEQAIAEILKLQANNDYY